MLCICKFSSARRRGSFSLTSDSRIMDNLNGGIASSDRIDGLGKGIAEYLRSKYVDVPKRFLARGKI